MAGSRGGNATRWSWGTDGQLWACRLSHALGLVVLLAMLVVLGATPPSGSGQAMAAAAPAEPNVLLIQQWRDDPDQGWNGVRTPTHKYVRYDNGDEALYDLTTDPDELVNLARDSHFVEQRAALAAQLDAILAR